MLPFYIEYFLFSAIVATTKVAMRFMVRAHVPLTKFLKIPSHAIWDCLLFLHLCATDVRKGWLYEWIGR